MNNLIKKYIKEKVSKLRYKGDSINLENVYPSILEEALGGFDGPYSLSGYDCDYWATVGDYKISGCMRFGTAEITLIEGESKPLLSEENKVNEAHKHLEIPKYSTVEIDDLSEDELKELNTYYFTFGIGQKYEGMYQPIMARNIRIASDKMREMHGTKWSDKYTQEEWNDIWKDWGPLYEGKNLETIVVL